MDRHSERDTLYDEDRSTAGHGSVDHPSMMGRKKRNASKAWAFRTVVLALTLFCLILCLFVFANEEFPNIAWLLVTLSAVMAGLLIITGIGVGRGEHIAMGTICLANVIVAAALGAAVERHIMKEYWHLSNGAVFNNVSPMDARAGSFGDATEIHFTKDAFADTRRTLGMRVGGNMYCVAPVAGSMQAASVEFWTVGINCCLGRTGFSCDDSADSTVRSAISVSKYIGDEYDKYQDAIEQAKNVYGIMSPDNAILVRWVANPDKSGRKLWTKAVIIVVVACALEFFFACIISCAVFQDVADHRSRSVHQRI